MAGELKIRRYVANSVTVQHENGEPFTIGELQDLLRKLVAMGYEADTPVQSVRTVELYAQLPPLEPTLVRQLVFGGIGAGS